MLQFIATETNRKNTKKKNKYEMKRLVLQEIEHEIRQHKQQYKNNPDLF